MATTPNRGNRYPLGADPADVPLWIQRLAQDVDFHAQYRQGLASGRPAAGADGGKAGDFYHSTDTGALEFSNGSVWKRITPSLEHAFNFLVAGEVRVPSGQLDVIPPAFILLRAGQTAKLTRVKDMIGSGTSVTYKITKNGIDVVTGVAATTTGDVTDFADDTLADGDRLQLVVTAVSGTPQNLSVAVGVEYNA